MRATCPSPSSTEPGASSQGYLTKDINSRVQHQHYHTCPCQDTPPFSSRDLKFHTIQLQSPVHHSRLLDATTVLHTHMESPWSAGVICFLVEPLPCHAQLSEYPHTFSSACPPTHSPWSAEDTVNISFPHRLPYQVYDTRPSLGLQAKQSYSFTAFLFSEIHQDSTVTLSDNYGQECNLVAKSPPAPKCQDCGGFWFPA